jgi:flagellar basal body rod protein FlgB
MFSIEPVWNLLSQHLDACALRQAVYSANIANADVAGYQPLEVDFESQLRAAASLPDDLTTAIRPTIVPAAQGTVELDQQLALMSMNGLHYQSLLGAFERSVGLLRLAVLEGKEG